MTLLELANSGWAERIRFLQPKIVLELGTGQGASGACIMAALATDAVFLTINYADGHQFGEQLIPWSDDARLTMLAGDTLDPATLDRVPKNIDLMFLDTTHEAWHASLELRLWQDKLRDGAIVIVDDLDQRDMLKFWASLPYEKALSTDGGQGAFRYNRLLVISVTFDRPEQTTYGGLCN